MFFLKLTKHVGESGGTVLVQSVNALCFLMFSFLFLKKSDCMVCVLASSGLFFVILFELKKTL